MSYRQIWLDPCAPDLLELPQFKPLTHLFKQNTLN